MTCFFTIIITPFIKSIYTKKLLNQNPFLLPKWFYITYFFLWTPFFYKIRLKLRIFIKKVVRKFKKICIDPLTYCSLLIIRYICSYPHELSTFFDHLHINSCYLLWAWFFTLHMVWVIVPIGQYTHQERGLKSTIVIKPINVDVSMIL